MNLTAVTDDLCPENDARCFPVSIEYKATVWLVYPVKSNWLTWGEKSKQV